MGTLSAPAGLTGPVVIGTFVGTREDKGRQFLLVKYFRQAWSKDTEARIEFVAFDPRTGQPTQVGDSLRKVASGTVVAVGVDVDARPWNKGAFPTYLAESIHTVDVLTTDGVMRAPMFDAPKVNGSTSDEGFEPAAGYVE